MSAEVGQESNAAEPTSARQRRRRRVWLVVTLLVIAFLLAVCWVGLRAITVRDGLVESEGLIEEVQSGASGIDEVLPELSESAASAGDASSGPVWWLMEWIPVVGDNLRGARLAAQSLDALVNSVAVPVIDGDDGTVTERLLDATDEESERVAELAAGLDAVSDSPSLIPAVRDGVEQVDQLMSAAAPAIAMLPTLLGADGARNYLVVVQNNAESQALGGSTAAQLLVNVKAGEITVAGRADAGNYLNGTAVDVDVPDSAIDLYTSHLVDRVDASMSRPDFPTAAQIMRTWWQRDIAPDEINGVISIDPMALSRILVATGPIALTSGDVLDQDNAVALLLSEVYGRWDAYEHPDLVDGYFADVTADVVNTIAVGRYDLEDMLWAITESAQESSLLVWSDDAPISEAIKDERITGELPPTNADATALGVYFDNASGSKIDYFTETATTATAVCEAGTATFTTTAALTLPLTQQQAEALPRYVQSTTEGARFRDWIYLYGPVGTTLSDLAANGQDVTVLHRDVDDLGRPVVAFEAWFDPGDAVDVTATFVGSADEEYGPLELRTNPMVHGAEPHVADGCAG